MRTGYVLCLAALLMPVASANTNFVLEQSYRGGDFLDSFTWENFDDPTHGRVNYVDQATATSPGKMLSYGTLCV